MTIETISASQDLSDRVAHYPLLEALIERRSRHFGKGFRLNGGPLAYASTQPPQPLSPDEEAALAFAACGITGPVMADLPYQSGDVPEASSQDIPFSRTIGAGPVMKTALKLLKKELPVPTAVGLEHGGATLLKPFCPPYYRDMEAAVLAYVDCKYAQGSGTLRDGGAATAWRDGAAVQSGIPLLRSDDRRDDRLLRLRLPSLWALPRQQWAVSHGAGVSGPPPG